MSRVFKFEIDGHAYVVTKHPAPQGLPISLRFVSTGLAAVAEAVAGGAANVDDLAAAAGKGAAAVQRLLEADDADRFVRRILAFASRDGEPLSDDGAFERAFSGNYGELYQALVEVVVGNGFLPGLATWRAMGARMGLKLAPAGSTGSP